MSAASWLHRHARASEWPQPRGAETWPAWVAWLAEQRALWPARGGCSELVFTPRVDGGTLAGRAVVRLDLDGRSPAVVGDLAVYRYAAVMPLRLRRDQTGAHPQIAAYVHSEALRLGRALRPRWDRMAVPDPRDERPVYVAGPLSAPPTAPDPAGLVSRHALRALLIAEALRAGVALPTSSGELVEGYWSPVVPHASGWRELEAAGGIETPEVRATAMAACLEAVRSVVQSGGLVIALERRRGGLSAGTEREVEAAQQLGHVARRVPWWAQVAGIAALARRRHPVARAALLTSDLFP